MVKLKTVDIEGTNYKGINFEYWGGFQGFLDATSNGAGGSSTMQTLRRVVPWLAKATDMTANAISALPFDIVHESGEVFDTSTDWKNKVGGIDSPQSLLMKLASSLCMGRAYLIPKYTSRTIVNLQYCAPHTVLPEINQNGLQYFNRTTDQGKTEKYYPVDVNKPEMMYFWLPDSDVEIGPALSYPAGAALLSASLLFSMDGTIQTYSERGFVPATLLLAKGMPSPAEREKAENWWNRFLRGWTKEAAKILNAEAADLKQVGAGMEQLKGVYGELVKQAIENVGTAFGIPAALFMSDMAFASEVKGLTKSWYETSAFVKIYKTIEDTFNTQLLKKYNLRMAFRPETLDVFKEDEAANANAYKIYVDAGILPSVAAQMVGLELPEGVEYKDLDAQVEKKQAQEEEAARVNNEVALAKLNGGNNGKEEKETAEVLEKEDEEPDEKPVAKSLSLSAAQIKELNLWRQISERHERKGEARVLDFKCKSLDEEMSNSIKAKLGAGVPVAQAFEIGSTTNDIGHVTNDIGHYDNEGLKALADAINRATDIPEVKQSPQNIYITASIPKGDEPNIVINVPEQLAPIVNVTTPEVKVTNEVNPTPVTIENTVNVPEEKGKEELTVKRDAKGNITGMVKK